MSTYFNPYFQNDFGTFFLTLLQRLWQFVTLQVGVADLAPDEIQLVVLVGISISGALVGCFLVLRKMSMLANALSHTILLGVVLAFLVTHPEVLFGDGHVAHDRGLDMRAMLVGAFIMGIVTTFLTEFLTKTARLQEDASIGLVFTSLFALGVVLITLFTRNAHIGTEIVMGNVDALHVDDIRLVWGVVALNATIFLLLFKEFKITTFDAGLARSLGLSATFFNYLLMVQVSATAIGGFRAVGVLMILALIVGPPLTARFLTDRLWSMLLLSIGVGAAASIGGVAFARHILIIYGVALSNAGRVFCVLVVEFLLAAFFAPGRGVVAKTLMRKRIAAGSLVEKIG